jgi:hypothetical protein
MQTCPACGRVRNGTVRFCTGCGAPFPDSISEENAGEKAGTFDPGLPPPFDSGLPPPFDPGLPPAVDAANSAGRPRRSPWPVLIAVAFVLLAGLAGGGTWLLVRAHTHHPGAGTSLAAGPGASASPQASSPASPPAETPVTTPPAPSPSAPSAGTVAVASAAAQQPDTPAVTDFLNQYFAAINDHDYQAYTALLDPGLQQNMTAAQFDSGYGSTADSSEMLTGTSTAANGDTVADVTFTSRQNPAESVNHREACTDWQISLFLESNGTSYVMGPAPAGYRASSTACP